MKHIAFLLLLSLFYFYASAQENKLFEPISDQAFQSVSSFFEYDDIPLDVRIIDSTEQTDYIKVKLVFTGIANIRVPAILALPKTGEAPFPCVLGLTGGDGEKSIWFDPNSEWPEPLLTKALVTNGYALLALDGVNAGERVMANDFNSPMNVLFRNQGFNQIRDVWVQSVIEHRRAIDYLETRPDIDQNRLGITSSSGGSIKSWILLANEPRLKVAVPLVTPLTIWDEKFWNVDESKLTGIKTLAPWNYAPNVNAPALMLMGSQDGFYTKPQVDEFFNLIGSKNKELKWYNKGHNLESDYVPDALNWFEKHLK